MKLRKIALLPCAAAAVGGVWFWQQRDRQPVVRPNAPSTAAVDVANRDETNSPSCEITAPLAYDVTFVANGEVHPEQLGAPGSATAVAHTQQATLQLLPLHTDEASGSIVLAKLTNRTLDGASASDATQPFLLRIEKNCAIAGYAQHKKTPQLAARMQQGFAHELMWRWPETQTETAIAENAIGRYRAQYQRQDGANGERTVTFGVEQYLKLWQGSKTDVVPDRSTATLSRGRTQWFERLERREQLREVGVVDSDSTVTAQLVAAKPEVFSAAEQNVDDYVWLNLLPQTTTVGKVERPITAAEREAQAALKGVAVKDALAAHVKNNVVGGNIAQQWQGLSSYLEANPEQTEVVAAALIKNVVPRSAQATAWLALGNARTPEAKAAMMAIIRDPNVAAINRTRAMFAVVDRDDLGREFAEELGGMAGGLSAKQAMPARMASREAALALGVFANLRETSDPAVYDMARTRLTNMLAAQTSPAELHVVFSAIANLGDSTMVQVTEPYFTNTNPEVRAGAMKVFRRIAPEVSSGTVARLLRSETDMKVKGALYEMLERQSVDAQRPFSQAVVAQAALDLPAATDVHQRRAIIGTLGPAAVTNATARQALMAQVRHEYENRTGLYSLFTQYLTADDIVVALAGAHQNEQ